jgi:SAM-dependent methyltransferase
MNIHETASFHTRYALLMEQELSPLDRAYASTYQSIAEADLSAPLQDCTSLADKAQKDFANLLALDLPASSAVLEVGPGLGDLTSWLRKHFGRVDLLDVIPHYINRLDQHDSSSVSVGDIQNFRHHDAYNLIVMCDVLEHLLRPADALLSCFTSLSPGGLLYVRVPAHESLIGYAKQLGCPYEVVHLRTYDTDSLNRELLAAGFKLRVSARGLKGGHRVPRFTRLMGSHWWGLHRRRLEASWSNQPSPSTPRRTALQQFAATGARPSGRFAYLGPAFRLISRAYGRPGEVWAVGQKPRALRASR